MIKNTVVSCLFTSNTFVNRLRILGFLNKTKVCESRFVWLIRHAGVAQRNRQSEGKLPTINNRRILGSVFVVAWRIEIGHYIRQQNNMQARLEERQSAYDAIIEQQKAVGAENQELRKQLEALSRINQQEKMTLENQIGSVILPCTF